MMNGKMYLSRKMNEATQPTAMPMMPAISRLTELVEVLEERHPPGIELDLLRIGQFDEGVVVVVGRLRQWPLEGRNGRHRALRVSRIAWHGLVLRLVGQPRQ